MENLPNLLEEDKDMFLSGLSQDKSLPAVQTAMEKEIDRVMYRYAEQCATAQERDFSQYLLQSLKSAMSVIDSVGDVRQWNRTAPQPKKKLSGPALAFVLVGAALILSTVLALSFYSDRTPPLLLQVLPPILGSVSLLWAGYLIGRPQKAPDAQSDVRTEYLADTDKVWRDMKAMLLVADNALGSLREQEEIRRQKDSADQNTSPIPAEEIELFSSLLEMAGASSDPDARDMVSSIRFYLHAHGVDAVDYSPEKASWFELLPASRGGTIRPALSSGGRLVKKGLASAN